MRELSKKNLHEVVVEGCSGQHDRPNFRAVVQVTLTANDENYGVIQATGISYTNPMPYEGNPNGDTYDFHLGYRIARGEAELSLGLDLISMDGGLPGATLMLHEQLVNAVHRTPMEIRKWRK